MTTTYCFWLLSLDIAAITPHYWWEGLTITFHFYLWAKLIYRTSSHKMGRKKGWGLKDEHWYECAMSSLCHHCAISLDMMRQNCLKQLINYSQIRYCWDVGGLSSFASLKALDNQVQFNFLYKISETKFSNQKTQCELFQGKQKCQGVL